MSRKPHFPLRALLALAACLAAACAAPTAGAAVPSTGAPASQGAAAGATADQNPVTPYQTPPPGAAAGRPDVTRTSTVPAAPTPVTGGKQTASGPNSAIVPARDVERSTGDGSAPAPLVALAVLALALVALGALALLAARRGVWDARPLAGLRHALGEAGARAGATWSELGDWLRIGR